MSQTDLFIAILREIQRQYGDLSLTTEQLALCVEFAQRMTESLPPVDYNPEQDWSAA